MRARAVVVVLLVAFLGMPAFALAAPHAYTGVGTMTERKTLGGGVTVCANETLLVEVRPRAGSYDLLVTHWTPGAEGYCGAVRWNSFPAEHVEGSPETGFTLDRVLDTSCSFVRDSLRIGPLGAATPIAYRLDIEPAGCGSPQFTEWDGLADYVGA